MNSRQGMELHKLMHINERMNLFKFLVYTYCYIFKPTVVPFPSPLGFLEFFYLQCDGL